MQSHEMLAHLNAAASTVASVGFVLLPARHQSLMPQCEPFVPFTFQRPSSVPGIFEGIIFYFDDTENWSPLADSLDVRQAPDREQVSITAFVAPLPLNAADRTPAEKQDVGEVDLLASDAAESLQTALLRAMDPLESLTATYAATLLQQTATARHTAARIVQWYREMAADSVVAAHSQLDADLDDATKQVATATLHTHRLPGGKADPRFVMTIGWDTPEQRARVISAYWTAALLMAAHQSQLQSANLITAGDDPFDHPDACWAIQFAVSVLADIIGHESILWT